MNFMGEGVSCGNGVFAENDRWNLYEQTKTHSEGYFLSFLCANFFFERAK